MALSRNEQIVVYILVVLVIGIAGTLIFLSSEYKQISINKDTLATKQAELAKLEEEYSVEKITNIVTSIGTSYDEGSVVADSFYEEMTTYQVDRLLRQLLSETPDYSRDDRRPLGINTDNMAITGLQTQNLTVELYNPSELLYDIKDKSFVDTSVFATTAQSSETASDGEDGDGDGEDTAVDTSGGAMSVMRRMSELGWLEYYEENRGSLDDDYIHAMRVFLSETSETVAVQTVTFDIAMESGQFYSLLVYAREQEQATWIRNFSYEDVEVTDGNSNSSTTTTAATNDGDADGDGGAAATPTSTTTVRVWTIEVSFLCVARLDGDAVKTIREYYAD